MNKDVLYKNSSFEDKEKLLKDIQQHGGRVQIKKVSDDNDIMMR